MDTDLIPSAELGDLEEKFRKILLSIPEAAMQREAARCRGPHLVSDFSEWDEYCKSLDRDLGRLLSRINKLLRRINWKGASMPSPHCSALWTLWWKTVFKEALRQGSLEAFSKMQR